jgi:D-amino peptidase
MKRALSIMLPLILAAAFAPAQSGGKLKVFISVDIEGITGVVNAQETSRTGLDYEYFRRLMTLEANAAIEGALAAGATEIVVRDAHGSARNIIPDLLNRNALLLRDWSGGPMVMMEGVDSTFDAAAFIGFHAKAGTPDALIEHTSSGTVTDFNLNGISMPEAGFNALMAGHHNVPVVFAAGDEALCNQAKALLGSVETVAVKKGIGGAALSLHPEVAREKIRAGMEKALRNRASYKPYKLNPPYILVLKLKEETMVYNGQFYPGAKRTGDWELTYSSNDLMEIMKAYGGMRR